jgi:hypothetical protein
MAKPRKVQTGNSRLDARSKQSTMSGSELYYLQVGAVTSLKGSSNKTRGSAYKALKDVCKRIGINPDDLLREQKGFLNGEQLAKAEKYRLQSHNPGFCLRTIEKRH